MEDRIAKQRLNIILLVDTSKSMTGTRINQVNKAILDIKDYLIDLEKDNSNVDFFITIIPFNTDAYLYENKGMISIDDFKFKGLTCGGWSNLHLAYTKLGQLLAKESKGGIMPDFAGVAPIILLLTDGHPTKEFYKATLEDLKGIPWFKAALRYGIAIELDDERTLRVLQDFADTNGDVVKCFDANTLKKIIKVIVITASKIKSSNSKVKFDYSTKSINEQVIQEIKDTLDDADNWEW